MSKYAPSASLFPLPHALLVSSTRAKRGIILEKCNTRTCAQDLVNMRHHLSSCICPHVCMTNKLFCLPFTLCKLYVLHEAVKK